jgi:heme exporter protein D
MGEEAIATGMIQGGWEYVWGAYGLSWAVLLTYTIRALVLRQQALRTDS